MKTALLIGATGLVGSHLVDQIVSDPHFSLVKVFVRSSTGKTHPKLKEHIIDFDYPEQWRTLIKGDVLFSALGTTIKKAGSKEAQYKVDYTYQYNVAKEAAENGVPVYVLVSSAGASPRSRMFYTRIKGELEQNIAHLPFRQIHILQPGVLAGARKENRVGEKIAVKILSLLKHLPYLSKYRPVDAGIVARAMIHASLDVAPGLHRYTLEEVFRLAK